MINLNGVMCTNHLFDSGIQICSLYKISDSPTVYSLYGIFGKFRISILDINKENFYIK